MSYFDDVRAFALQRELFSLQLENINLACFLACCVLWFIIFVFGNMALEVYILYLFIHLLEFEIKKALIDRWAIRAFPKSFL